MAKSLTGVRQRTYGEADSCASDPESGQSSRVRRHAEYEHLDSSEVGDWGEAAKRAVAEVAGRHPAQGDWRALLMLSPEVEKTTL